jgi:hypothetical protein
MELLYNFSKYKKIDGDYQSISQQLLNFRLDSQYVIFAIPTTSPIIAILVVTSFRNLYILQRLVIFHLLIRNVSPFVIIYLYSNTLIKEH